jgi:uncharacterized caspase-like protein/Tfp pilus assembly protein PilF
VLLRVVLFSFLLLLVSPVAHADKRVALVIGNSAYRPQGELTNPRNDATDVAAALKGHGFQVIEGLDLDKVALDRKIRDFAAALVGADVGLFFYAGHGLQVSGNNHIIPVDAELMTESALDFETVRLDLVQKTMERAAATNILIVDACRNNPFTRNLERAMGTRSAAIGRGLAPVEAGFGTLISFSTQPGAVAADGRGRNSPFTGSLVKHLLSSNEEIMSLLLDVRVDVLRETNRKQVPWEHTALTSRFYFKAGANPTPPPYTPNPVLSAPATPQTNVGARYAAQAALNEGVAAHKRGEYTLAITHFSEAIRLEPQDPDGFTRRGLSYFSNHDYDEAIADLSEAIRLAPESARAHLYRGMAYHGKDDSNPDRAIADYNNAIRFDPKLAFAFFARAYAYRSKKDFDRAILDYTEAIRLNPEGSWFKERGAVFFDKKDFDRAIADYDEAIRLNPNDGKSFYDRGLAKLKKGDSSGDADIAKARQLDPSIGK